MAFPTRKSRRRPRNDLGLARPVTLAVKATALSDLCDQLRRETGIKLTAGPSVADEKVTVFCKSAPLRDVMRLLSRPFGYTWLRSGWVFGVGSSVFGSASGDPAKSGFTQVRP